jgi:hypothetical protein
VGFFSDLASKFKAAQLTAAKKTTPPKTVFGSVEKSTPKAKPPVIPPKPPVPAKGKPPVVAVKDAFINIAARKTPADLKRQKGAPEAVDKAKKEKPLHQPPGLFDEGGNAKGGSDVGIIEAAKPKIPEKLGRGSHELHFQAVQTQIKNPDALRDAILKDTVIPGATITDVVVQGTDVIVKVMVD